MMTKDALMKEYRLNLSGPELKAQRRLIEKLLEERDELVELLEEECVQDTLLGLQNLLDSLADQAHDAYGIDCLLTDEPTDA